MAPLLPFFAHNVYSSRTRFSLRRLPALLPNSCNHVSCPHELIFILSSLPSLQALEVISLNIGDPLVHPQLFHRPCAAPALPHSDLLCPTLLHSAPTPPSREFLKKKKETFVISKYFLRITAWTEQSPKKWHP